MRPYSYPRPCSYPTLFLPPEDSLWSAAQAYGTLFSSSNSVINEGDAKAHWLGQGGTGSNLNNQHFTVSGRKRQSYSKLICYSLGRSTQVKECPKYRCDPICPLFVFPL